MKEYQDNHFTNGPVHRLGRRFFSWYVRVVFNTYLKVKVDYTEPLPETSCIMCSNHQSHLDAIILGSLGCGNFNNAAFIAAKDYWYDNRGRYSLSNLFFNLIPLSRKNNNGFSIRKTIEKVKRFSERGNCRVIILPEGTRSVDGSIRPFKPGVVTLAKDTEMPVVPVYIHNSSKFWPKGSYFIKPGSLQVIVGKPILPNDLEKAADLREEIITLSKKLQ